MKRFLSTLYLAVLALAVAGHATAAEGDPLGVGEPFPDFALSRSDGSKWQLGDYSGQPKLILFWATWCPYCRRLMPGIVELHKDFAGRGLEIVAVTFHDQDADTDAYAEKMGIRFDIVLSGDELARRIGVRGTPTVFVLDAENRVRLRTSESDPDDPTLRGAVELLIPPETAGHSGP